MELFDKVKEVHDRRSFVDFLSALQEDFLGNQETWENQSIDTFIDSIKDWVRDYSSDDVNLETPNWETISAMFYMGKIYE